MDFLFFGLSLVCLLMFLLGVINPKWVLLWGKEKTRRKVGIYFGIPFFVFFLLFTFSIPNNEQENKTAIVKTINTINTENNEYSEKAVFSSDMTEDEFYSLLKKDDLYNECKEISDRVSKYKRNKKWIIETTEYLLEKCDKWDMQTGGLGTQLSELQIMKDSYNYSNEKHKMYEGRFKGIGGRLIRIIYQTILRKNLYKFSIFLPINKDSLSDFFVQNQFCYIKDNRGARWGNYVDKKYSQSKVFNSPNFSVGWDKISGKLVSIRIPLGDNREWDKWDQKDYHYETFINAFAKPYNYSIQVIEMFADDDLRNYLYQQIENFRNYNQLKFEESLEEIGKTFIFSQTLTFDKYTIYIFSGLGSTSMLIHTTEIFNINELESDLLFKYLMEDEWFYVNKI